MSDRYCIAFGMQVNISAEDMNSCCGTCGDGYVSKITTLKYSVTCLRLTAVMEDTLKQHGMQRYRIPLILLMCNVGSIGFHMEWLPVVSMALTLAVCLTPCHIATIMNLVLIPIVQERQGLQPVPPSVNQVGDKHINCTAPTHLVYKVITQLM